MPGGTRPPPLAVLDAALTWTHGTLQLARVADTTLPTPCEDWDLRALLVHMEDSLAALGEAAALGHVAVTTPVGDGPAEVLVDQICRRARATRVAWGARVTSAPIGVAELSLDRDVVAVVGALEVVVHGWDVARTVGSDWQLPADLAARLLPVAREVVGDRAHRFAPALDPRSPGAADRLLAHLGRDPRWCTPALSRPA